MLCAFKLLRPVAVALAFLENKTEQLNPLATEELQLLKKQVLNKYCIAKRRKGCERERMG